MKKVDLGQTISIFANLGVIAGIVFLAIELQQNNELLAAQSRTERLGVQTDYLNALYQDEEVASLVVRAQEGTVLTPTDRVRPYYLGQRLLAAFNYVYGEVQRGLIGPESIPTDQWNRAFNDVPLMHETWNPRKASFSESFVEFIEGRVLAGGSE